MRRVTYLLYRAALFIAFPLVLAYLLWRVLKNRAYWRTLRERFGFRPTSWEQTPAGGIWLHAVSVGEVISSIGLVRKLRTELPGEPVYLSVATLAGHAIADQRLSADVTGIFYAPLDYCFAVRRVLRRIRPAIVVVMETEIWPNLWRETKRTGAALLVANGRISPAAMPRYRRLRWFFRAVLPIPDLILAQTEEYRLSYLELGAQPERVRVGGNLKYDFAPAEAPVPEAVRLLLESSRPAPIWIAASTMPPAATGDCDEDELVLDVFERLAPSHKQLLLLLVPRRPERFDTAAALLQKRGIRHLRRSSLAQTGSSFALPGVLLVDSIGELSGLFQLGDIVFMGGTLARRGGHNILEPAFFSKPIISGPNLQNFPDVAEDFRREGALVDVADAASLAEAVDRLARNGAEAKILGAKAGRLARVHSGATVAVCEEVRRLLEAAVPCYVRTWPAKVALSGPSWLWGVGGNWKRARGLARARRLSKPVVSIGGISMGGAGKTPVAVTVAGLLKREGLRPAFLTRGYGRRSGEILALGPGQAASVNDTGDEAQILLRSELGPVGIGADRYQAGRKVEAGFGVDIYILDDGFQHAQLERDLDLVMIDMLDPLAGGAPFPLGRMREPIESLSRADAFVLTRARAGRNYTGILELLRQINPEAPVFMSRVVPIEWVSAETGESWPVGHFGSQTVVGFCGLGNPASFWTTLDELKMGKGPRLEYADHNRYRPEELAAMARQALRHGAIAMVTTEKDFHNLPHCEGELPVYWLRTRVEIAEEQVFLSWLRAGLV